MDEVGRTRLARAAAEAALVRVVHHYGERPGFVVLGGLVPELLSSQSPFAHAGTTDVDVQVNLELAAGAVNASRLERALRNAEFEPDAERAWRWVAEGFGVEVVVRFELLADLDDVAEGAALTFDGCDALGAANLRGTGYAARDVGREAGDLTLDLWIEIVSGMRGEAEGRPATCRCRFLGMSQREIVEQAQR